jgi:bacillithiol biosynthesis deacetylase BshB1
MNVDVLAVGAHPDDAELGVGGTLIKLARRGFRTGLIDLTRGELASRGTPEERNAEAYEAGRILGLATRLCAGLPDGDIRNTVEQRRLLIEQIRLLRPTVLLAPHGPERHPDHTAAHELVRDANFFAGVAGIDTGHTPYRAPTVYYYYAYYQPPEPPALVVDITQEFDMKLAALEQHKSQFHNPAYAGGKETWVSSRAFWEAITTRAAYWGGRVGVRLGEPLYAEIPFGCDLPPGVRRAAPPAQDAPVPPETEAP